MTVAAVVEVMLLRRILFHQAGGWGNPEDAFADFAAWAAAPFLWAGLLLIASAAWDRLLSLPIVPLIFAAVAGPLFGYIALAQYSHSTPFFMLIGFGLQGVALLVASVRTFRHAT